MFLCHEFCLICFTLLYLSLRILVKLIIVINKVEPFTDSVVIEAYENIPLTLSFKQPSRGPFQDITWYKRGTQSYNRMVEFRGDLDTEPRYFNWYCDQSSPCSTSNKGELDVTNGEFTIYQPQFSDRDYYYYHFYRIEGDSGGDDYEIQLRVFGKSAFCVLE